MKQLIHLITALLLIFALLFANATTALANEGDSEHSLEMEVNGYHISLSSQNEWVKGDNTVVVTLTDEMGMPVSDAEVEILIAPNSEQHTKSESDAHGVETSHDSMSGIEMGEPEHETSDKSSHNEEATVPVPMMESHDHGQYTVETHLAASGKYEVQVFFHVNGEMLQADFIVEVPGMASKTIVLWSFVFINVGLIISAGVLKSQSVTVKGK